MVCQRVSELAAHTDLAKQMRVMVKERLVDCVRELRFLGCSILSSRLVALPRLVAVDTSFHADRE